MKTTHRILISIGGGALIAAGALLYLRRAEQKIHAQQKMTTVLVAKRFIPAGKPIKVDEVEERPIPEAYLQPLALSTLKGKAVRSRRGVAKGEQITRSNVYEEGTLLGLAWALSPGKTAVALQLPLDRAAGGHIGPGDHVDVLAVLDKQPGWDDPLAVPLFSRVRVLAINDKVLDASGAAAAERREMSNEGILVTLELSLEGAARLMLAEEKGHITLALTSPLDTEPHSASAAGLRSLKR
jgi:pilus assembly protein CpaB